jgi:hypothetical protein
MEMLQGSRMLPIKHFSLTSYSSSGNQTDFKYWHDIDRLQNPIGLSLRLHSSVAPSDKRYWSFQIMFYIRLRGFILPVVNTAKDQICKSIQQIGELEQHPQEQPKGEGAQKSKEQEQVVDEDYSYSDVDDFQLD